MYSRDADSVVLPRGRRRKAVGVATVAMLAGLSGCIELDVVNPNGLGLETVFVNASNTDAALIGAWKAFSELHRLTCPTLALSVYANEQTSTSLTYIDYSGEPRVQINNLDNSNCLTRSGYYVPFEAAASAREAFQGIKENGLKFGAINAATPDGSETPSRLIWAKFIIAISELNHALQFDKAFISDTTTSKGEIGNVLSPASEVRTRAVAMLRNVIVDSRATPSFTLPNTFVNGRAITRDQLIQIAMGYIIRAQVYFPRTPAERAAVNWGNVLAQLDSTVTTFDFGHQADVTIAGTGSTYITNSFAQNTLRISNRLLGPADTSGQYQAWAARTIADRNAFTITTPDRRIHGATNTTTGTRFIRLATTMGSAANGPYLTSSYRSIRYLNTAADSGSRAFVPAMSREEMKFIRAEALARLGRGTEAAALINPTRVAANLTAVTASGPLAGRECVPKRDDGSCGDLLDAIQYEKRIELFPYLPDIAFYDARGWGKLVRGTPVQFPVTGRELLTIGLEFYTFGGVGGPSGAP